MSTPGTRRSERKRAVNTRIADLDSSPTQRAPPPSRKRKASNQAPPRPPPRQRQKTPEQESAETLEDTDDETAIEDDEVPRDADLVIPHLTVSKEQVTVLNDYANSKIEEDYGNESIKAFAKICGRDWTYYVQETTIYFGREQLREEGDDSPPVHIDLGPSKVVSRTHAVLSYNHEAWYIEVCGRNGIKLDNEDVRKGETKPIHCGTVIAIAGTEMLLQIPDVSTNIAQMYKDRVVKYDEELDDGGLNDNFGNVQHPVPYYPMQAPSYGPFPPYPPMAAGYAGQPNIAPAPPGMTRPVTPTASTPKQIASGPAKRRSPSNRRGTDGIMMESTEQIDYSAESSREIKPACSYASMITWAILSTPEEAMALADIYLWIKAHYAFYRYAPGVGWQNSIRHNLSLNQAFQKIPRRQGEPGKGMKWKLKDEQRDATIAQANKNASKGGGRVSSAPGTPSGGPMTLGGFPPAAPNGNVKTSPTARTPPLSSYPPTQHQSYTPTRGPQMSGPAYTPQMPQMPAYAPTQGAHPVLSDETSPMPKRRANGTLNAINSSPTLTSSVWPHDAPLRTPAPRPHNLSVPQPNTAKLPTSHLADSSPAPFWKYEAIGSTPASHWPDISPVKANDNAGETTFPSSSPPPMANAVESPTRKPRPPIFSANQNGNDRIEDDDGGIDITRGFEKISSFHEQRSNANGVAS